MKVLVTGATGRIGNNLARHLMSQGHEVRGTAIPGDRGIERAERDGIELVIGNLRDPSFCESAVAGCDAVMHLGAMLLFGPDDDQDLFEDNLRSTFNMMEAAANAGGMRRFVFASSDEVYPSLFAKYLPIDESHPKQPYSFYGVTKLAGETMGDYFFRRRDLPVAVARFALTIEPWEVLYPERPLGNFLHLSSLLRFIRNRSGDESGGPRRGLCKLATNPICSWLARRMARPIMFQYCDVRDLVQGLQLLLEHPAAVGEAFNLSGPAPFSYDHAVKVLAEATGRHVVDVRLPGPPIRIHHSTAKARNMLGYNPVHDIRSTVEEAIRTDPGRLPA